MTEQTIAQIAAGLTKAQREAIRGALESKGHGLGNLSRWHCQNAGRFRKALLEKGIAFLAIPRFSWRGNRRDIVLTTLGEAVRAHLLSEGHDHDRG